MNLVEELRDDFLVCHICFEEYQEPKQLPCLHTFCRQCLGKYIVGRVVETGGNTFPCPFCRKAIQPSPVSGEVKSWVDSFPTNFLLSQLSSKLKEKTAAYSGQSPNSTAHDLTTDREFESRAKCSDHPQLCLVGYCTRQRRGVCEECCLQRHSDCIRSHVRERETRLLAEERRSECQQSLGALQIKLEGLTDRIVIHEADLASRGEQLTAQTEAALGDLKSKLDLFFSEQRRELSCRLDNCLGKEANRLKSTRHQAADLTRSVELISEKLNALEGGSLTVKDLAVLDKAQEELKKQEQAVEKLRKDCVLVDIHFHPNTITDKVLKGLTVGTIAVDVRQPKGGARPRLHRYISDPSSSMSNFVDHVSLPAQRSHPDVFEDAPDVRRSSKQGRALSPPGAGASSLSTSPSTAEGPGAGEWEAPREHVRRRSEGPVTMSAATRRAPNIPDFGSVLIEESRRSRSAPRRPRPLSEGASSSNISRRRAVPMETAIDGSPERERSSERNARTPQNASSRSENPAGGSNRPERAFSAVTTSDSPPEEDMDSMDTNVTFVHPPGESSTNAAAERDSGGSDSEPGGQSARRIVCVRHFMASHGSDVKNHPGLVGICAVCKDRVAVSDRWNKVVKLLDISGRVMDVLTVPGGAEPWDLTLRRPGVLAVTYPKEQKIRMVDVVDGASRMYYRSHFMTRDGYASLAAYDPTTLIASVCPPFGTPKIHLLDYMGAVLRALDTSQVAYPRCVDVCSEDEICVSDWTHHNVKIFPPDGHSARITYSGVPGDADAQLKAPMGVCWSGRGHVFIVDGKLHKLHAVCSQTGTCSAIISLPQGLGSELKLVTFVDASPELCRSERALVVTTTTGSVQVYDLGSNF